MHSAAASTLFFVVAERGSCCSPTLRTLTLFDTESAASFGCLVQEDGMVKKCHIRVRSCFPIALRQTLVTGGIMVLVKRVDESHFIQRHPSMD